MTHKEMGKRRERIAKAIFEGGSLEDVARAENASGSLIALSCKEWHNTYPLREKVALRALSDSSKIFPILALFQTESCFAEIARQVQCSRERVSQVAAMCRKHGINLEGAK